MTITYTAQVATCSGLGCFWKLLFRWHGSIYKLLWPNLVVYSIVYFSLSIIYRFSLDEEYRILFEKISLHCQAYGDLIPIAFVLGFYVSIVIKRWWDQYICMPWPDNLAMFVSTLVHGQDDRGRLMRRTIIRYVNLCLVITLRMMSPRVKKRFPTMDHLIEAGFLQPNEKKIFEDLDRKTSHPKYWMPLVWAGGIITRARKEGRIKDDFSLKTLIDELNIFRSGCGGMLNYDWISIPLVYTQVVTLAVYTYFMATLMGNQFLDPLKGYPKHEVDLVVPVFTFLQFFFYMGWLKVAESLVNPFGEDDDDFELNWLVDRNLQVSYVIVDEMHQEHPEMVKDQYWDEVFPAELPYTVASKLYQTGPPPGSADNVEVSLDQAEFMPLETVAEEAQDEVDDLGDELEVDDPENGGQRRETHPMKIITRQITGSSGSINTNSYSGHINSRKSSVLNMLAKLFRREESSRDLAGSNMGSSISLPSRRGQRSSSRMSTMSQTQSRTSIPRINTFQDEVFHMSDVSLAGSATTAESPIQITVSGATESKKHSLTTEEEVEVSETYNLISWSKEKDILKKSPKQQFPSTWKSSLNTDDSSVMSKITSETKGPTQISIQMERTSAGDSKFTESPVDATSETSDTSVQTSFFQENWNANVQPSESAMYLSPQQKVPEFQNQTLGKSERYEWRDIGPTSSSLTSIDPCSTTEATDTVTQVVMASSAPKRHLFTSLARQIIPAQSESKTYLSNVKDEMLPKKSSLSRSLQQQYAEQGMNQISVAKSFQEIDILTSKQSTAVSSNSKISTDSEGAISILSPAAHFDYKPLENQAIPPSVSVPSTLIPSTSIITTTSLRTFTTTSPALTTPLSFITQSEKIPELPQSDNEGLSSHDVKKVLLPQNSPSITDERESMKIEDKSLELSHSPPLTGPPQYIPSAAIPVPSVSPAHVTGSSSNIVLIEAAMAPLARRTHHDFHELEPISEHGETGTESPMVSTIQKQEDIQPELDVKKYLTESTV